MTLLLRNLQKSVDFNFQKLRTDIMTLRRVLRIERYDVAVICMDDTQLKELNRLYRQVNEPTDVLSFPAHEVRMIHGGSSLLILMVCKIRTCIFLCRKNTKSGYI